MLFYSSPYLTYRFAETQWSFMNKASSFPHFASFGAGAGQDDGMNKMVTEPIHPVFCFHAINC